MIVAGIMSGTSLDGIDVALVEVNGARIRTLEFLSTPYPSEVRRRLLGVSNCETHTREITRLHFLLPELYAAAFHRACKQAGMPPAAVELIGCHGQTIYHESGAATLQIGDGNVLAERAGVPVVCDFRPADIAAGGTGAPLVPFADYLLFHSKSRSRVALNIGGIANITWIPAGAPMDDVVAFDTGPGNMVIDQLMTHYSRGRKNYDKGGAVAGQGMVHPEVVAALLDDPYYSESAPKTAGREQFGPDFVQRMLAFGLPREDTLATATYFTAATIAEGIAMAAGHVPVDEVIVSGGGVHNKTLLRFLRAELPETEVARSEIHGIDPDAKEAIAFAVLARETWRRRPSNLPSATGARRAAILGKICLP